MIVREADREHATRPTTRCQTADTLSHMALTLTAPRALGALAAAGVAAAIALTPITTSDADTNKSNARPDVSARHGHGHAHGGVALRGPAFR